VNFVDWMNLSMLVDISFLVFAAASVWKIRKLEKKITHLEEKLNLSILNPSKARRALIAANNKVK
tara:strand:- start:5869 stop:6063 length:195 start_codon:yes stop_codon:yes gene_type:complete